MAGFFGLGRRHPHERAGFLLYSAAVEAARAPFFYRELGVPDTLDGRFDMVCLHAFLLVHRLQRETEPGPALAQAVFDAMFSDMDVNLREMGVGDLSVGRRVKAMWEAFHGRSLAYETALDDPDQTALSAALARNVWRGANPPDGAAETLARMTRAQVAALRTQTVAALANGDVQLLAADTAAS